jgi:hypothetical protein
LASNQMRQNSPDMSPRPTQERTHASSRLRMRQARMAREFEVIFPTLCKQPAILPRTAARRLVVVHDQGTNRRPNRT